MFLVVKGQDSTCSPLNLLLLFINKGHGLKVLTYHVNKSHIVHTLLKQEYKNFCQST